MSQYSVVQGALAGNYTVLMTYSGEDPQYIGKAKPGSATSDPVWQIQFLTYSGGNMQSREWANASSDFKFVWDSRASYSYS